MRNPFNTVTIALMPIAIVINMVIYQIVYSLGIPLYLDSIGTILAGVLCGPLVGALVGLLTNVVLQLLGLGTIGWFTGVAIVIGLLAGWIGAQGWLRSLGRTVLAAIGMGIITATISAFIQAFLLGGISGAGTDVITAFYLNLTQNVVAASLLQGYTVDPLDKVISFLLVFFILRGLPRRLLVRFPQGEKSAEPRRQPLVGRVN